MYNQWQIWYITFIFYFYSILKKMRDLISDHQTYRVWSTATWLERLLFVVLHEGIHEGSYNYYYFDWSDEAKIIYAAFYSFVCWYTLYLCGFSEYKKAFLSASSISLSSITVVKLFDTITQLTSGQTSITEVKNCAHKVKFTPFLKIPIALKIYSCR